MKATFTIPGTGRQGIRDLLLSDSLLKTLNEFVPDQLDDVLRRDEDADTGPVDDLLRLKAMVPPRRRKYHLFVGLNGDAQAHLNRNILFCTRPLTEEMADFARRHGLDLKSRGDWCRQVLENFEQVVFFDRFHLAASIGFAPWIKMALVDQFPIRLQTILPTRSVRKKPRILLLDHRLPEKGQAPVQDDYRTLEKHADLCWLTGTETREELLDKFSADIHLHCGFSNRRAAELSPLDSIMAPTYTIILPDTHNENGELQAGNCLAGLVEGCSYVKYATDLEDTITTARDMIRRISAIAESNIPFNPEMRRFQRRNSDFLTAQIGHVKGFLSK